MTVDENKALVRRFIDEIFVQGRVDAVDELLADSGRSYRIGEIHIFRIREGRVVEHWHQYDQLGMMRQLGAMPG